MSAPTILFGLYRAREVVEYYFCMCIGYGPWYRGLTCVPYLAFFVCSLVLSERVSPVSWFESALIASVGEEQRAGFLRSPVGDVGSESEVVLWPGLLVGEAVRRRPKTEVSVPVGEVGRSRETSATPPQPDLPVGDWIAFLACWLDTWAIL